MSGKTALIDVGGGFRDVYGSGVMDYLMDQGIRFDHLIGVSAGAANTISYAAEQSRRNLIFYFDYTFRPEYMGMSHFIRNGNYLNLDYIYGDLTNEGGENPLDYDRLMQSPVRLTVVAADADTGVARYFEKEEIQRNHYDFLKASSCIPVMNHPVEIEGHRYFDGGLADPVPLDFAFEQGADKVVLLLTKPANEMRKPKENRFLSTLLHPAYPVAAKNLSARATRYNQALEKARSLQEEGKVLILGPDDIEGMNTLTKDRKVFMDLYLKGYHDAKRIPEFLHSQSAT